MSLFVSSIMIGVITYISVLERTKEIGILRALGASKRDISRVFNAETLIIGFMAGMLGILVSLLLILPINRIIYNLAGMHNMAYLPVTSCAALVLISMFLTLIAGLIPSGFAARRDPVVALRSERNESEIHFIQEGVLRLSLKLLRELPGAKAIRNELSLRRAGSPAR